MASCSSPAAQHAKRVGSVGILHSQRNVGEQFLFEARAQVARSDVLSFAARERRRIDGENHCQRRLVDDQRLKRLGGGEIGDAFADLDSFHSGDGDNFARGNFFGFVAFQAAKRKELGDLGGQQRSIQLGDAHFGAALERPLENAGNGHASQKIAVIKIGHLNLQHGRGIARRRRNGGDDLLEERLESRRSVVERAVRDAELRVGIDHREIELVFGGVEVDEEIVDFVEHGRGARVRPVDFIQHHDGLQLRGQRLLQHVARLRQWPFARVHQHQHAVHHAQRALDFSAEVAVTGRVHDVDLRIVVRDGRVLREDGDAALALEVVRVHDPRDYFLIVAEDAALLQHGVDQSGLAVVHVRDDGDVANR